MVYGLVLVQPNVLLNKLIDQELGVLSGEDKLRCNFYLQYEITLPNLVRRMSMLRRT